MNTKNNTRYKINNNKIKETFLNLLSTNKYDNINGKRYQQKNARKFKTAH